MEKSLIFFIIRSASEHIQENLEHLYQITETKKPRFKDNVSKQRSET